MTSAAVAGDWADLGIQNVGYTEREAILYAIAVGAGSDDLDLVYEQRAIHALPMWATAVGLCVTSEAAAALGYSRNKVLHIGQRLVMHGPMPLSGEPRVSGRLIDPCLVWP